MGEVIMFPGNTDRTVPQSMDEVLEAIQDNQEAFAEYLSNQMGIAVVERLMDEGFHLEPDMASDIMLMMDSITSLYHKAVGADHEMHAMSSTMYDVADPDDFINNFYDVYCEGAQD